MKRVITLLILFYFFNSCENKEPNFSKEMIEKLYVTDDGLPSYYLSLNLFVLTNNDEICQTNNHELFFFFKEYYFMKYKSFEDFLNAILNKDFVMDKNVFKNKRYFDTFKLNSKIEKEYSNLSFNKFLKKYSKASIRKGELELNKSSLNSDNYSTVKYFLYLNRYDVSSDCYIGKDYIRKREDSFK
ncbi:hypothetical protein [Flavobacterium piscis]|uniref:Lipoprotein n=1 Tax=Flavobacterium piscis TaxID=1114874 RepID=A0ABU1Y370_9FLAO|nr:hypothetical protein [Flavobacterium piscis]MDR7208503.1 hypothetical protein [Flavobacterium piscis]